MSDTELENVDVEEIEEVTPPVVKKKRQMTEAQKANLQKARETRAANLKDPKRYPKGSKRDAATERYQAEIEEKAEALAEKKAIELIQKKKQEKELAEYREWKKNQQKIVQEPEPIKKKKAPVAKKVAKKKPKIVESDDSDSFNDNFSVNYGNAGSSFIDNFLD